MRSVSLRFLTGVLVATLCLLGSPAGRVTAQEKVKPAEGTEEPSAADQAPNPAVEAVLAANQEASPVRHAGGDLDQQCADRHSGDRHRRRADRRGRPYPAQITVSGLPTAIGRLEVRLNHLTHTFPGDLDILLVGPAGQNVMLMSDIGGGGDVEGVFLTFSDGAPALTGAQIVSGTYAPTNTANRRAAGAGAGRAARHLAGKFHRHQSEWAVEPVRVRRCPEPMSAGSTASR